MKIVSPLINYFTCILILCFSAHFGYTQCSEGCEISFGSSAGLLTGFTDVTGNNDILNMNADPQTLTQSFNVYDENDCTCPVVGGGGVDDITLTMTIDDNTVDAYGGVSFDYDGTSLTDINQSTSGLVGLIDLDNTGTRDVSPGDYLCYTIEVDFAPHLHQLAENVCVSANSINTGGEHFESTTIVFWDDTDTPYGTVNYQGFYEDPDGPGGDHPGTTIDCTALNPTNDNLSATTAVYTDGVGAVEASTQPGVFVAAETTTVIADNNPGGNGNPNTCEVEPGPDGTFDGVTSGVSIEAVTNSGLADCDIVGGFTFMVCLEDVSTTTTDTADNSNNDGDGTATGSDTGFTSTLRGFNFSPICCPETQTVADVSTPLCESDLGTVVDDWKATIEATDGSGAVTSAAVAPSTTSIVYTSNPSLAGTYDNTAFTGITIDPEPSYAHSGTGCDNEMVTSYAYVLCDKGTTNCSDFVNYDLVLASTLALEFYPPAQLPTISRDDDVCNYTIASACPGDVISPSPLTALPGETPSNSYTVTTANGCENMFTIDVEACPAPALPEAVLGCPSEIDICGGTPASINASDANQDTAASSTAIYGGTAAGFINTMGTTVITDDVIDPSLIPNAGTYNLTLQLMSMDGTLSETVTCTISAVVNCDANGGDFPTTGP